MIDWLMAVHKRITRVIYWPMRQIANLWIRHVVTWIAHGVVAAGVILLAFHFGEFVHARIAAHLIATFYVARETLEWIVDGEGWPLRRADVDAFVDAAAPVNVALWLVAWLAT